VAKAEAVLVIKAQAAEALEGTQETGGPQVAIVPGALAAAVAAALAGHLPVLDALEPVAAAVGLVCLDKVQTALAGRQVPVTPAVVAVALLVVQETAAHPLTAALAGRSVAVAAGKTVLADVSAMAALALPVQSVSYGPAIPAAFHQHVWALNL
jgi:hypothetical protein